MEKQKQNEQDPKVVEVFSIMIYVVCFVSTEYIKLFAKFYIRVSDGLSYCCASCFLILLEFQLK